MRITQVAFAFGMTLWLGLLVCRPPSNEARFVTRYYCDGVYI